MSNGAMALYSGSCNNLTLIDCDDNSSDDGFMPALFASGLVAGNTYYIRFWGVNNNNGDFKICIKTPSSCDLPCVNPISFTNGTFSNSNNTIQLCANVSTVLSIDPNCLIGVTNITYQWKYSNVSVGPFTNITGGTNPSFTITNANNGTGFYQVVVNFTSASGTSCSQTIVQAVTFNPLPSASFTIGTNGGCSGSTVSFNSTATIPAGNSISSYSWNFGDGLGTSTLFNAAYAYQNPKLDTTYKVSLIAFDTISETKIVISFK
jgi:PKD repeat protein